MKICFFMQRRFALVANEMARQLQQKYPDTKICGYVQTRSSFNFITKQNNVIYTKLLLDEDINALYKKEKLDLNFLKKMELEYLQSNLWSHVELDRIIRHNQLVREYPYNTPRYSHEDMLKILQVTIKNILNFLDKEKPDVVIFSVIGALSSSLLYCIAKAKHIPVYIITPARVDKLYTLTSSYKKFTEVEKIFANIKEGSESHFAKDREKALKFLRAFRDTPAPYAKTDSIKNRPINKRKQFKFLLPKNALRSLQWLNTLTYQYIKDRHKTDYSTIKPWYFFIDKIKQKIRVLTIHSNLYHEVRLTDNFAFFPLQVEPEISTMLYAPFFTDQLWLAKQIAKSLPIDFKLYIKEHPAMYGKRPKKFYTELKKIPNLRLIKPSVVSFDLIQNAKLVTVISSTVGWEALMLHKPVITFGDVFFNKLPGVQKCEAITDLPNIIKERLAMNNHDEQLLINYITALYHESVTVDMIDIWEIEGGGRLKERAQELESLVELIAQKIGLQR